MIIMHNFPLAEVHIDPKTPLHNSACKPGFCAARVDEVN